MKRFASALLLVGCLAAATSAHADEVPPPSVAVEGVATVPISKTASSTEADNAYRQGLAAAIADGLGKAEFLAEQTAAKVGSIDQIEEAGGSVDCEAYSEAGSDTSGEPYEGAEPDFGSVTDDTSVGLARAPLAPAAVTQATKDHKKPKKHKKKHRPKAKKAGGVRCTLSTQVLLAYLLT